MRVRGRAAYSLVQRTLTRRCPEIAPGEFDDDYLFDEGGFWIGAQPVGRDALLVYAIDSGTGVTAEYGVHVTRFDLVACTETSLAIEYYDSSLTGRMYDIPPSPMLTQFVGPMYDASDPAHAYATLLATPGACTPEDPPDLADAPRAGAPDLDLLPLPFPDQPWFSGRPRPQARVWKEQVVGPTTDRPIRARVIEPPTSLRRLRVIDGLELFGADLPGRNGGLALALYDPRTDRHRWLLATRGCLQGTAIYWLAAGSGLVIGYAASDHPIYWEEGRDGLFALDLNNARAYRLLLAGAAMAWSLPGDRDDDGLPIEGLVFDPTPRQIGRIRQDPSTLRTRCGAPVPLSAIRAAIDAGAPATTAR